MGIHVGDDDDESKFILAALIGLGLGNYYDESNFLLQVNLYNFLISTCGKCKNSDAAIKVRVYVTIFLH